MLLVFIITLAVSFVVVRIGAIAFQLTGLEWSLAKFQSLSCFTGTGFTTKEAELITGHWQRRKVASILMVLGNAGLVILIATGASSIIAQDNIISVIFERIGFDIPDAIVKWVNTAVLIIALFVFYKIVTNPHVTNKLTIYLRKKVIKIQKSPKVSFEELTVATGGYGVIRLQVNQNCPVLDKTLLEAGLRKMDITVLAIIRGQGTIANPTAEAKIKLDDELVCFGKLGEIRNKLCPPDEKQKADS